MNPLPKARVDFKGWSNAKADVWEMCEAELGRQFRKSRENKVAMISNGEEAKRKIKTVFDEEGYANRMNAGAVDVTGDNFCCRSSRWPRLHRLRWWDESTV